MTDLATRETFVVLAADEARALTEKVKDDAEQLWVNLLRLYEGDAHTTLGYDSWGSYFEAEFNQSSRHGYRLLEAARVREVVASDQLVTESQARELAPLLDQPEQLREAWDEASTNGAPTASTVREAVGRRLPPVTPEAREKQRRWVATMNVLDGLDHFDRPAVAEQAEAEAALIDQDAAATRRQTVTPERLRSASAWAALLADALERTAG